MLLAGLILLILYCVRKSRDSDNSKYTPLLERSHTSSNPHVIGAPYEFAHIHGGGKATSNLVNIEDAKRMQSQPATSGDTLVCFFCFLFFGFVFLNS